MYFDFSLPKIISGLFSCSLLLLFVSTIFNIIYGRLHFHVGEVITEATIDHKMIRKAIEEPNMLICFCLTDILVWVVITLYIFGLAVGAF